MQFKPASSEYFANRTSDPDGFPSYFYKFFPIRMRNEGRLLNDNLLSTFRDSYLWHADPSSFNDPFDCYQNLIDLSNPTLDFVKQYVEYIFPGLSNDHKEIEVDKILNDPLEFIRRWRATTPSWKVCSFSRHQLSNLMWSHYADCHTGLCLKFDTYSLGRDGIYPFKVTYESDFKPVDFYKEPHEAHINMITTKSSEWSYEKEYRTYTTEQSKVHFNQDSLVGVTFGCKTSKADMSFMQNQFIKSGYKEINWYQARMQKQSFDMVIESL